MALLAHHERFERGCIALLTDAEAADPPQRGERWREVEGLVEHHLDVEEHMLLPAFERISPREAATIHEEHARIREAIARGRLEAKLGVIRVATVRALILRLQEHAVHEDASLYVWAAMLPSTWIHEVNVRLAQKARPMHTTRP